MTKIGNITVKRHSYAHLLAVAVLKLYPQAKLGMGPAIENGFYYDFDIDKSISVDDLPKIEAQMKKLISSNISFEQEKMPLSGARKLFEDQPYKLEIIDDIEKDGQSEVSIYKSGEFTDLCNGPHISSTNELDVDAFKLERVAGVYWKNNENNKQLQRIYGVAFDSKKELEQYTRNLEEAEDRDHRKIGNDLDLFSIDPLVGNGLVLWHPKGAILWRIIEDYWYKEHLKNGYELVRSPHIGSRKLWEKSGHWDFYSGSMYSPIEINTSLEEVEEGTKVDNSDQYLLKPMNCPFHIQIYNSRPRSYRELPIKWAECGTVYRYEKSGELLGLTRVRGFTQDDAHIICSKEQAKGGLSKVVDLILSVYKAFGFDRNQVKVYLSLRDNKDNIKYTGSDEGWEFTESILREVAQEKGLDYKEEIGEAAFYGPKLDFKINDVLGREWQCSTLQFDFNLPERFNMTFINKLGEKEKPYVLHRALFGSFERFIGLLIEHYAGAFPTWLAPVQARVISVSDKACDYVDKVVAELSGAGVRVDSDKSNETLGKKIRMGQIQKIPYLLIVGDKEKEAKNVAVRSRDDGDMGAKNVDEFAKMVISDR